MTLQILILLAGLALIIFGADWLVDGAGAIARKAGVSEFVIGLTIVGFGTSCPELVVSLTGALQGNADVSIGNVVGSNIFNSMLILGLTALLMPVPVTPSNKKRDIPVMLLVTFLLAFCGMSRTFFGLGAADDLSRAEGIVFLLLFALYMVMSFRNDEGPAEAGAAKADAAAKAAVEAAETKAIGVWGGIGLTLAGLAALIFGGQLFVNSATWIARAVGVSDKFIAVTLLAGGTSFPELATCVVAAIKKKGQLALGNILGSNVFNILLILGCSATVTPLSLAGMTVVDIVALLASAALIWLSSYTFKKDKIDRYEGAIFLLVFAAYYFWLFTRL